MVDAMRLGVPYQGSKNAIAREIVAALPGGRRFVDLFAGGCAVTHAAVLSGKYDRYLMNDALGIGSRLFLGGLRGDYADAWRQWVTREDFEKRKGEDPAVALCWSFSNNMKHYLYGRDIEEAKRLAHAEAVRLGSYETWRRLTAARRGANDRGLEAVERLRSVAALQSVAATTGDYREAEIGAGDVVYCDPPYAGTESYAGLTFDSAAFWNWAASRHFPVFVSEYHAPDTFAPIWRKGKLRLMNQYGADGKAAEFLFVQRRFAADFQTDLLGCAC